MSRCNSYVSQVSQKRELPFLWHLAYIGITSRRKCHRTKELFYSVKVVIQMHFFFFFERAFQKFCMVAGVSWQSSVKVMVMYTFIKECVPWVAWMSPTDAMLIISFICQEWIIKTFPVPSHQEEDREEMSANVPTQYSSLYQGLPHCPQLMSLFACLQ